jgi:hypothetical protein
MEMTPFPLHDGESVAQLRADFRALLANTISRQRKSRTANIVLAAQRNSDGGHVRDDSVAARVRYFAGNTKVDATKSLPFGSFISGELSEFTAVPNYDRTVYQDGLGNGKTNDLEIDLSEHLATLLGQEKPRSL